MLNFRNIVLGGMPRIIVPVMGADTPDVLASAREALDAGVDALEWRVDYYETLSVYAVCACLQELRQAIDDVPLLFTVRTASQGGRAEMGDGTLAELIRAVTDTRLADAIDIELDCAHARELVQYAHEAGVLAVVSQHNFKSTPPFDILYDTFQYEFELGADICKLAVMAQEEGDELRLMAAANQFAEDHRKALLIAISMGELGAITRVAGEFFGSVLTFCTAGEASAPGQMDAHTARAIIAQLHEEGYNSTSIE